jgi:hypothetical protein
MASDTSNVTIAQPSRHSLYLKLAREIAMDLNQLEDILKTYKIPQGEWERIAEDPAFTKTLQEAAEAWDAAENANARVQLKAAYAVETLVHKMYEHLESGSLTPAYVTLFQSLIRLAGMGFSGAEVKEAPGSKFVVNINLGADQQIKIEKEVTPKVIDGEVVNNG